MFALHLLAVLLGAGAADVSSADAPAVAPPPSLQVTLVALAADVHACVLRTADHGLARFVEGATLAPEWRVTRVAADGVTLHYSHRLGGQAVDVLLHLNESVDLAKESSTLAALGNPAPAPARVQVIPKKTKPGASH